MKVYITYPTALEYWLYERGFRVAQSLKKSDQIEITGRKSLSEIVNWFNFKDPVHIAVNAGICRKSKKGLVFHLIPKDLPQGSFIRISKDIYIACPELCFLLAAGDLTFHKLVLLANNLCAQYVQDETEDFGQRHREPVTSTELIGTYLESARGIKYVNAAKRAIKYALDNSNSPMESKLALLAMLPLSSGGYGIKKPELNYKMLLSKKGPKYLRQDSIRCDMIWKEEKVALEYDSNLAHLSTWQHSIDKARISELSSMNFQIISVTSDKIKSFSSVEELFLSVKKSLKMHPRRDRMKKYFEKRWDVVHDIMLRDIENML